MKKLYSFLPLLAALLVPGKAAAQMLPDSTVQFVAYWEVGDSADYTITEKKYAVGENEEETQTAFNTRTLHVEVIAATDSTYTLAITQDDPTGFELGFVTKPEDQAALPKLTYTIETSEFGAFRGLDEDADLYAKTRQSAPALAKAYYNNLSAESKAIFQTEQSFTDYIVSMFEDSGYLNQLCIKDVSDLLFYHGAKLDTSRTYSYSDNFLLSIGATVDMDVEFKVDSELTDEYSAVVRRIKDGSENMYGAVLDFLYTMQADEEDALSYDEFRKEYEKEMFKEAAEFRLEEYTTEEIHLDTGWPIQFIYDFYNVATTTGEVKGTHVYRQIRYVVDKTD